MADQKDQGTNPPAEEPAFPPLTERAMAEKSLVGFNRATEFGSESISSDDSGDGDLMDSSGAEEEKLALQELERKAYFSVLEAFALANSTTSDMKTQILEKLKSVCHIAEETHISFEETIQKHLFTLQERDDSFVSDEKGKQIDQEKPLTTSATESSTCVAQTGSSWGSVNPESLVGKFVRIRTFDGKFVEYTIKEYDAKQDMHRLMTADLDEMENEMETDDPLGLVDLREISSQDIMWESGKKPDFHAPN